MGNSGGETRYQFIDSNAGEGLNFYRLKQVDKNGKVAYSLVVAVNRGKSVVSKIAIYPNPAGMFITLTVPDKHQRYSGKLINGEGKLILNLSGDVHQINLDLNASLFKLKAGMYVIKLNNGNGQFSQRFMKE